MKKIPGNLQDLKRFLNRALGYRLAINGRYTETTQKAVARFIAEQGGSTTQGTIAELKEFLFQKGYLSCYVVGSERYDLLVATAVVKLISDWPK